MSLNQYFVVLFKKGAKWTEETSPELDAQHKKQISYLSDLYHAGKLAITGPFDDHSDADLRAMAIFYRHAFSHIDELKSIIEADELIKNDHLFAEYATWYFPEGQSLNTRHAVKWTSPI